VDNGDGGHHGENPEGGGHGSPAVEEGAEDDEDDALGALHEANLAGADEGFGAGAGVADHEGCGHDEGGEEDVEVAVGAGVVDDEAEEDGDVGVAVEDGVEEGAEDGDLVGLAGDATIDHVEEAGADDDEAGVEEHADVVAGARVAEEEGRDDVDEKADEGEGVGRDLREREAVDDLLEQPAAAFTECECPSHRLRYYTMDGGEFEDFEFALAVGGDHGGGVADLFAEEGAADGAGGGDEALGDVGLFAGDELVGDLFVLGAVEDDDGGAVADAVAGDVVEVDHGELAHALLELAEAGVDELLALLGGVVLGVFAEVSEGDGLLDLGRELDGELLLQDPDLFCDRGFNVFHTDVCSELE